MDELYIGILVLVLVVLFWWWSVSQPDVVVTPPASSSTAVQGLYGSEPVVYTWIDDGSSNYATRRKSFSEVVRLYKGTPVFSTVPGILRPTITGGNVPSLFDPMFYTTEAAFKIAISKYLRYY